MIFSSYLSTTSTVIGQSKFRCHKIRTPVTKVEQFCAHLLRNFEFCLILITRTRWISSRGPDHQGHHWTIGVLLTWPWTLRAPIAKCPVSGGYRLRGKVKKNQDKFNDTKTVSSTIPRSLPSGHREHRTLKFKRETYLRGGNGKRKVRRRRGKSGSVRKRWREGGPDRVTRGSRAAVVRIVAEKRPFCSFTPLGATVSNFRNSGKLCTSTSGARDFIYFFFSSFSRVLKHTLT